jgi:hypothetical protein
MEPAPESPPPPPTDDSSRHLFHPINRNNFNTVRLRHIFFRDM